MKTWFRMDVSASDPTVADINVFDIIGDWIDEWINQFWGVEMALTAKAFVKMLAELPEGVKTLRVHINSPGGDCFAAATIANALRDQQLSKGRTVETYVDGLAASAASVIAMAGSKVVMADNALMMIHNPWTVAVGNAKQMRKAADDLDTVRSTIVATYKWHSELEADAIVALMDAETWMDADEAITNGFATDKVEGLKAAALIDPKAAAKLGAVPEKYRDRVQAMVKPAPAPVAPAASAVDVIRACNEAGCPELAESLVTKNASMEDVRQALTEAKASKTAAEARASAIRAACVVAKQPELADGYIAGGMTLAAVKAHLTTITAKLDKVEIDTGLEPDANAKPKSRIDTAAVYAGLNKRS